MKYLKETFLKTYANIPIQLRDDIIVTYKNEPFTWRTVYIEVIGQTEMGRLLLEEMNSLNLI